MARSEIADPEQLFQLLQLMFAARNQGDSPLANLLTPPKKPEPKKPPEEPTKPEPTQLKPPKPLYARTEEGLPAASAFVRGMIRRGWTPEEAAGAAGNVHVESGFRPGVKSSLAKEQSFGLMQWNHERLQGLMKMAMATGRDWQDPETQMDWINMERTGESMQYGGADERDSYRRAFKGGGSAADIAERFGRFVERPKSLSDTLSTRRQMAENYLPTAPTEGPQLDWQRLASLYQ
jgi:Phage tail lysozyme